MTGTFVGPFFFEFGHEYGQIGSIEGDGRVRTKHIRSNYAVQELWIINKPDDGIEEIGRESKWDIWAILELLVERQVITLKFVVGLVGSQVLEGDIDWDSQEL